MIRKKGFTLLELLIVVLIIGILASMAIPQYQKTIMRSKAAEALTNLAALRTSMDRYWYEQMGMGQYTQLSGERRYYMRREDGVIWNLPLDIGNPNNIDTDWCYGMLDSSTLAGQDYIIEAGDRNDGMTWIQINQDGEIRKSLSLGGSGDLFGGVHVQGEEEEEDEEAG